MLPKYLFATLAFLCTASLMAQFDRPSSAGLPTSVPQADFGGPQVGQLNMANRLLRSGRTEQAIIVYDGILAQFPNWIPALAGKANVLRRVGRDTEANTYQQKAMRVDALATGFIMSRGRNGLLRYLALFPERELMVAAASGQEVADFDNLTNADFFAHQLKTIMELPDTAQLAETLQAKVAGDRLKSTQALHELMRDQVIEADLGFMLEGNLDMLNHDYLGAVAAYNQAVDFHATPWPEITYNRGLAFIMLDNYTNGCAELQASAQQGFQPAQKMLKSLCNF